MDVEDGAEAGGGLHRLNAQLPYADLIPAENERLLAEVKYALDAFRAQNDFKLLLQACSGLDRMRKLKYAIDGMSALHIAESLYSLAFPTEGEALPWRCGDKVLYSLAVLLGKKQSQLSLIGKIRLDWRPMLAALELCTLRGFPTGSSMTERSRLIALLQLIGQARRYWGPGEDREIWNKFKAEIAQVQAQGAFKALFLFVEFFQSTDSSLYDELLPSWFSLWGQVDHCPAWDGAWLTLLCRARKHASPGFDWTPYMADIYSFARASIHTPVSVGDAGSAPLMRGRRVAYQYQSFGPSASRLPGVRLNKVSKLMIFLLGKGGPAELIRVSDVAIVPTSAQSIDGQGGDGGGSSSIRQRTVSPGALSLLSLFRSLRTYFHPSNGGRWSLELGLTVNYVLRALASRAGAESVLREEGLPPPPTGRLTRDDAGLVVDALLPLVLEMVYSKDPSVGSLSNMCLASLASLSPKTVAPASVELILRALDPVASINHTHQAPAAILALGSIFRPLMHPRPYLAPYLPALLELTLPGLDSSDVFKTTVTLQLYHLILSWIPVQGSPSSYSSQALDGWQPAPLPWLDASDDGGTDEHEHLYTACEGLGGVMLEWSIAFLDRLFEVLRHKDKSSKVKAGDLASDTMNVAAAMAGTRVGNAGMLAAGRGGRSETFLTGLITVVTQQLFTMADEPAAKMASAKILQFAMDRALPNVEKDVAAMVEMAASARPARAVATFLPALCDGLLAPGATSSDGGGDAPMLAAGASPVLLRWRLQLISGLARGAGAALAPHGSALRRLISAGISHKDKRVRKVARKLLRKALIGLCEIRTADRRSLPPSRWENVHSVAEWRRLCEPLPAGEGDVAWVEPSQEGLALAALLLEEFLQRPMRELTAELAKAKGRGEENLPAGAAATASVWREHLKTMDYALRGAVCLLADRGTPGEDDDEASGDRLRDDLYLAVGGQGLSRLLAADDGPRLYKMVAGLRAEIVGFMRSSLEACAQENGPADVKSAKLAVRLSQRIACMRGAKAHEARRKGSVIAAFKSQQRAVGRDAARKMRLNLARKAAANGDTSAVAAASRKLMGGSGGVQACPRALFVARASLQHEKRQGAAPRTLAFAAKNATRPSGGGGGGGGGGGTAAWPAAPAVLDRYRSLLSALMQLSSSEYAMVRAAAQVGVNRVGGVYPWFAREAVPELIGRLSLSDEPIADAKGGGEGEAAHQRLTGALYLLHQTRSMRHVVSKWSLSRSLLLALCDSQSVLARLPADKQEKAAARVTILFNTYVLYWRSNPLATDKDREEYDTLLNGLLERLAALSGSTPSTGGGWRYQLLASWCLMHLIRPSVRPPIAVWQHFTACLSEGDGQPLQRLALGALKRLLSNADPTSPLGSEVSKLLSSKAFLEPFFLALAYNHQKQATEGGLAGGEKDQWSLGVKEVLHDSGRGDTRELFPRLRFAARSPLFWARNASLVSAVVDAAGDDRRADCIRTLLEKATAAKAVVAHEDKRSFDCAAAEVAAGVLAVLAGPSNWSQAEEVLGESVLPFVETALDGVSLDGRLDWTDAIRFALDRSTPWGCEPLVSKVVERAKEVLQDGGKGRDDYSVLVKWLSFLGGVLIELSGRQASIPRASSIAKEVCPLLLEGLDHPFKACREEIARNLFLCTNVTDAAWAAGMANGVRESILAEACTVEEGGEEDVANAIATLSVKDSGTEEVAESALLASAMEMSDGALTAEQEAANTRAAKHLSLRRETVLQWLHQTAGAGDHVRYLPILVALLPVALQCVRDSNAEVAGMGRGTCLSGAAALTIRKATGINLGEVEPSASGPHGEGLPGAVSGVMSAVLSSTSSESWRVRRGAAAVACVLQTRLHFVLEEAQHSAVDAALLGLLGDTRREVQETARLAVSTRVAHLTAAKTRELCATFVAGADSAAASRKKRRKVAKRQAAMGAAVPVAAGEPSGAMQEQQRNVLGLSAVVLAAPCDVPEWVPGALESLAKHVNDESPGRLPVRQTVTHTFKEFRRTHQDKWEESHKLRFSRDQLDTFYDVLGGAHSYFI